MDSPFTRQYFSQNVSVIGFGRVHQLAAILITIFVQILLVIPMRDVPYLCAD